MIRALVRSALMLALAVAMVPAGSIQAHSVEPSPCEDRGHPDFGSHHCKVARLRARPFVVVAVVDSGINPYHLDFRLPSGDDRIGVHPSEYLEGFPTEAPTLELPFQVEDAGAAYERDAAQWRLVQPGIPAHVAGTNVLGAVPPGSTGDFFDATTGHGTGAASVAGGFLYGKGPPDVMILAMNGRGTAWRWAAKQPWVDLISISWTDVTPVVDASAEASREAAAAGKISCAAAGNAYGPLIAFEAQGPATNVHVGAVSPTTSTRAGYSGFPVDIMGLTDLPAASHDSDDGERTFGGTSAATPHACALLARAISEARRRVGDVREGPHDGGLVAGPAGPGALEDGIITRLEVEDAVQATATPVSEERYRFVTEGYGLVEGSTIGHALAVLFGDLPRPSRPDEDAWAAVVDGVREAIWSRAPDCPPPWC